MSGLLVVSLFEPSSKKILKLTSKKREFSLTDAITIITILKVVN